MRRQTVFPRLGHFAVEYVLALPVGAAAALIWANTAAESYYRFAFASSFFVNEIAMVLFFALITKEIVEATAPGGVLHSWRRVLLPVIAALGATLVPALLFPGTIRLFDEPQLIRAWPAVFATDLALAYFVARLLFGRHPVIPFLLLLAIAANGFGFVALALVEPTRDVHLLPAVTLLAAAILVAGLLRSARVKSFWPYVGTAGLLSWLAFFFAGFHPALALAPIVPFLPHAARDPGFFVDAPTGARDALNRLELWIRYPAQVALFFFALINAGIQLRALEAGVWALPLAVFAGRPVGLLLGAGLALAAGLHLPGRIRWRELVVVGFVMSIGFTMALFFATAALAPGILLTETRMSALLTVAGGGLALASAWILKVGRFAGGRAAPVPSRHVRPARRAV